MNIQELTRGTDCPIVTYHDAFKMIVCRNPTLEYFLDECTKCLSTDALKDFLKSVFADQFIERIEYQCWQQTDRSILRTEITDAVDFAEELCECLFKLKSHSFIDDEQSSFLKYLKKNLKEGEFLLLCDFAENYAFVAKIQHTLFT